MMRFELEFRGRGKGNGFMRRKLRVGIIGCGGIAFSKHMPGLKTIEEVKMVAFCDIIEERAVKAKKEFGCKGAKVYTDYRDLLKDESIDVVHICTPNRSHSFITIDSLHAGKHVMVEKPMAKTAAEAREMVKAAKETGKKLTVGYQNRCRPESIYLRREIVDKGKMGEIYYAKALALRRRATPTWGVFLDEYEQGGGPLIDIGTHALDLTLYMMNNYKPKLVLGTTYKKLPDPNCGNVWGPWDPKKHTVEDAAFGFIVMEDGATVYLESSWALNILDPIEASTVLCGTKMGAQIKNKDLILNYDENGELKEEHPIDCYEETIKQKSAPIEARQWIDAILYDRDPVVLPEEACVVSEILEAIYLSAKTGKPVRFNADGTFEPIDG